MLKKLSTVLLLGGLLGACTLGNVSGGVGQKVSEMGGVKTQNAKETVQSFDYKGARDYTKTDFDQARSEGKKVLVFFHANWCPTCREQRPINEAAFPELVENGAVVFVANFNDSETNKEDEALARDLKVYYQHTFVGFDGDKEVYRYAGTLSKEGVVASLGAN